MPVPVTAAATASRAAVVASVWGREEECDVGLLGQALARWLPPRSPGPGRSRSGPPTLADPDRFRKLGWLAGLAVVGVDEVVCSFDYPDEAALLDPLLASMIGRTAVVRAGEAAVRAAVRERLAGHRLPAGGYRLRNLFRVLVARAL